MPQRPVVGVLLVVGRGSRFDTADVANKLPAPSPDGTPVAMQAARYLVQAPGDVVVVVPVTATYNVQVDQLVALLAEAGCGVLRCPSAACDVGANLAAGVAACPQAGGCIIALADVPQITPETITRVANAADPYGCVALLYAGQRGRPIGFGADSFVGLTILGGNEGVRQLIDFAKLILIEADDAGILRDVGTPADLAR